MTRAAECAAGVARTSGCWRVELVAAMPRVDCPRCGVVVASVPWAEPGSRFTRDFEAECAWLMTVANQKTVSGFLHVSWRTAGTVARRVAERVKASMPSPFDGLHAIGVDECVCSIESGPCERVDVFHVSGRFWSTSACGEKRTPARPAWTSFPS